MTDVVLNKKILGHRAGTVLPYTKALEGHVRAGNATVLPAEHEGDQAHPSQYDRPAEPRSPLALAPTYDAGEDDVEVDSGTGEAEDDIDQDVD